MSVSPLTSGTSIALVILRTVPPRQRRSFGILQRRCRRVTTTSFDSSGTPEANFAPHLARITCGGASIRRSKNYRRLVTVIVAGDDRAPCVCVCVCYHDGAGRLHDDGGLLGATCRSIVVSVTWFRCQRSSSVGPHCSLEAPHEAQWVVSFDLSVGLLMWWAFLVLSIALWDFSRSMVFPLIFVAFWPCPRRESYLAYPFREPTWNLIHCSGLLSCYSA